VVVLIKVDEFLAFLRRSINDKIGNFDDIILPARTPELQNGSLILKSIREEHEFTLDGYRAVDPVKILLYLFREEVLNKDYEKKQRIIAGVKACDLKALRVLDAALITEEFADPSYKHWRDHTLIISADCTSIGETCHCNLVGGKPFAEAGFDLNLSRLNDHYMIEVGSEKGKQFLELIKKHAQLQEAPKDSPEKVHANRENLLKQLADQNKDYEYDPAYREMRKGDMDWWKVESKECVGCGGCTNICPTCYCLILNDESDAHKFVKTRTYDSCQLNGYARVAGGATPRPKMHERFRNRYLCKFDYMHHNFDMLGCTGCGRCIDTCPASINFREVVHNIHKNLASQLKTVPSPVSGEV
jgi:sulfhydrogenase subunit beta (sulfur reductase)